MKLRFLTFSCTFWLAAMFLSAAVAQSSGDESTRDTYSEETPVILESEEEIWEYLQALCEVAPTQRCATDQIDRVHNGEAVPMPSYREEDAYGARDDLIEAALLLQPTDKGE